MYSLRVVRERPPCRTRTCLKLHHPTPNVSISLERQTPTSPPRRVAIDPPSYVKRYSAILSDTDRYQAVFHTYGRDTRRRRGRLEAWKPDA
ncbi:unnamed protein product, partial [Iphiclides podalirius]